MSIHRIGKKCRGKKLQFLETYIPTRMVGKCEIHEIMCGQMDDVIAEERFPWAVVEPFK